MPNEPWCIRPVIHLAIAGGPERPNRSSAVPEWDETRVSLRSHMKRSVKFLLFLCLVYPVI